MSVAIEDPATTGQMQHQGEEAPAQGTEVSNAVSAVPIAALQVVFITFSLKDMSHSTLSAFLVLCMLRPVSLLQCLQELGIKNTDIRKLMDAGLHTVEGVAHAPKKVQKFLAGRGG
jgi:hypothetical protein